MTRAASARSTPFSVPHFVAWAKGLVLDTDEPIVLEPFQLAFIADVFSGVPEAWLVVPEGNGKTTILALLALYHCEFRPHAVVAVAAASREQAQIMYSQAEGFVLRSERLHERLLSPVQVAKGKAKTLVPRYLCLEGYRRIIHHEGGRIQVFAADDRTGDGIIPTMGIIDEPHRQRDLSLYRTWAGKLQKRGGQLIAISTAGEPGSDFEKTRERIRQQSPDIVRDGSFLRAAGSRVILHEWAVPEGADVEDLAVVKSANPFSGITPETLASKFASPTMTLEHWQRFVCNLPTRGSNAAIQEAEWAAAEAVDRIPPGEHVWLGLDVAWQWDTTAMVPLWEGPEYRLLGPATVLTPPRDGTMLSVDEVKRALVVIHQRNPIHAVVMDVSYARDIAQWIDDEMKVNVIERGNSNVAAAEDYERFMEGLRNGTLKHSGDQALKTHALNAIVRILPLGDPRFDRPAETRNTSMQDRRVIDALTAAAMVNALASVGIPPAPVSVYEARGAVLV